MSNNIDTSRFYQFLSNYKHGEKKLADTIDDSQYGNSDGTLIKGEFREFVKGEYNNWSGESKSDSELMDLANRFWSKIDTNTSGRLKGTDLENLNALDKDEEVKMEEKLGTYIEFNKYMDNVEIPSVLVTTGLQWKKAVAEELSVYLEQYIANGSKGDMAEFLNSKLPAIANKQTAIFCAVEYQNQLVSSILSEYPDYKIADDKTLQALINKYVSTIKGDTKPEQIMEDIKKLVDAYLATAGIGNGNADDLGNYGYSQNESAKLNDIQKEVVMKKLLDSLKSDKDYEEYKDYYATALEKFVSTLSVADLKNDNIIEKFKASKAYQCIQTLAWVKETYCGEIKKDSDFYKALQGISDSVAEKIASDAKFVSAYNDIINDVLEKVANGELTKDGVQSYIIEQIKTNLEKFYPNGLEDMSLDEMAVVYKTLESAAASIKDSDKSLEAHRNAALKYCNALNNLGDAEFQKALEEVFGSSDYTTVINKLLPSEIKTKMATLIAKVKELGDTRDMKVTGWGELQDEYSMQTDTSQTIKLGAKIQNKDGTTVTGPITYTATSQSGAGISFEGDSMVITSPGNIGTDTITITAYVRGRKIEPSKTITVKYTYNPASDIKKVTGWGGATSVDLNTIGTNNNGTLTDSSFADLYNNNGIIQLRSIRAENKNSKFSAQKENI